MSIFSQTHSNKTSSPEDGVNSETTQPSQASSVPTGPPSQTAIPISQSSSIMQGLFDVCNDKSEPAKDTSGTVTRARGRSNAGSNFGSNVDSDKRRIYHLRWRNLKSYHSFLVLSIKNPLISISFFHTTKIHLFLFQELRLIVLCLFLGLSRTK